MKKTLYKPQVGGIDTNVNVYGNESCTFNSLCNITKGCSIDGNVAMCECNPEDNFVAGCGAGGGINVVLGCGG